MGGAAGIENAAILIKFFYTDDGYRNVFAKPRSIHPTSRGFFNDSTD
jgi:hypothetical protein